MLCQGNHDRGGSRWRSALSIERRDGWHPAHGSATARTQRDRRCRYGHKGQGTHLNGPAGMTLDAQPFGAGRRMTEAVGANRAQPAGKNMPQIALHKLDTREGADFGAIGRLAILPAEGDGGVVNPKDAGIADGGARHVGSQVFEGGPAVAGGLNVHAPVPAPDAGIDLPVVGLKEIAQTLPEGRLQVRQVDEELRLFDAHEAAVLVETGAGYQAMDVRMK